MVDLTPEENIDIMIEVMSDRDLHLQASKGYKYTGTTVNLDGSEDGMICREAKDFWQELGMRQLINTAVAEVETEFKAGALPWTYKTVKSLMPTYPHRGILMSYNLARRTRPRPTQTEYLGTPSRTRRREGKRRSKVTTTRKWMMSLSLMLTIGLIQ